MTNFAVRRSACNRTCGTAMRLSLTILLAIHGTIHALGFLGGSGVASTRLPSFSGNPLVVLSGTAERLVSLGWLAALLAFVGAATLRMVRNDGWWRMALGGVLLSQPLIVLAWHEARLGTLANALILVSVVLAAAQARFSRRVDAEVRALYSAHPRATASPVERDELERLPAPVQRWLEASGVVGRARARTVRLKQRGELRTKPDGPWMPAQAEQYFFVDPPAFIWRVNAAMLRVLPIVGRDKYLAGHGNMLIKALSLLNVVNASDHKIDHGSMLRFLGEIVWFPSGALSPRIAWEPVDAASARATIRYGGLAASALFTFGADGRVLALHAERYLGGGPDAKLTPWAVSCSEWRSFDGVQVPSRGDAGWLLPSGHFSYYRWEVTDVEYNRPALYPRNTEPGSTEHVARMEIARVSPSAH